jgi:NAD dependent epimerase/dehydratase family enzyme
MTPLFRLGLGGRLGTGRQYVAWISLRDVVDGIRFLLTAEGVRGAVNLTGPAPVTNAEFTRALGAVLRRPAVFAVPRLALRLAVGPFTDDGILSGQRAVPAVLTRHGYAFHDREVSAALGWALHRPPAR